MSAILIKGTVVSVDTYRGQSKEGKPFHIHTAYVVNGSGKPAELKSMEATCPWKQGEKIEQQVQANIWRNEVSFRVI